MGVQLQNICIIACDVLVGYIVFKRTYVRGTVMSSDTATLHIQTLAVIE